MGLVLVLVDQRLREILFYAGVSDDDDVGGVETSAATLVGRLARRVITVVSDRGLVLLGRWKIIYCSYNTTAC